MDVDTRLLRYFAAIAEEGNLTRAAQRLFVSQPSLTKQLKHLESQLGVRTLFSEPRCVALLSAHPLANRPSVDFRELRDDPVIVAPALKGTWREHWLALSERDGREVRVGAVTDHPDEFLGAIAGGHGIALVPASTPHFHSRPDIVYVPVTGVSPSEVAVAWLPDAGEATCDFVRCCVDVTRSRRTGCGTRSG
jgi:DNA-binding transcriptional LysR family regulator